MSHPWKSRGEKRTVVWSQEQPEEVIRYLLDMQDAIRYAIRVAYRDGVKDEEHKVPSPIALRREIREWFYSYYSYARHHINPVCRTAVAMLRSCRKNHHGELRIPDVKKLAMVDGSFITVNALSPEELAIEKASAYMARRKVRDLYDLFFLIRLVQDKEKVRR